MRRIVLLFCCIIAFIAASAQDADSLYGLYLTNRGEDAIRIANEIMMAAEDTTRFTSETPLEVMEEKVLKTMIFWHFDRSEMVETVTYAQKAIEMYKERGALLDQAGCYNLLGVAYQRMGQFEEAINSYNQCNLLMAQLNEQEANPFYEKNIRYTTNNMAAIYSSMGELEHAEEMFSSCVNMLGKPETDTDYLDLATYYHNLSDIYMGQSKKLEGAKRQEKIDKAVELAELSLDYSYEYGDVPNKIIHRMMIVSQAYFASGRKAEAFEKLEEALQLAVEEEDLFLQTEVENLYGSFQLEQGQYHNSEEHFKNAIALAKENGFEECLLIAYEGARGATRQLNPDRALEYYEQSVALKDSIFNEKQQALIRDYQVKYDLAEKEHQLEIQQRNNRLQAAEIIVLVVLSGLLLILMIIFIRLVRVRKKQNETLARLNDTQNRILSVASHDVKTSVLAQNMVLKLANQYFDNMSREELKEKLVMLKIGSDELKDKLYSILHWIYGELGKEVTPPEDFKLARLIENNIKPHTAELEVKGLKIINDIPDNLMCHDMVNVVNIVFQNLISNAFKFSKQGGEIRVRAIEESDQVWVEVADQGVGISKELLQALTRDTVSPTKGTSGERGTGIGLFVSRQLMVKNGGQLLIESKEGEGTSIRFNIKKQKI